MRNYLISFNISNLKYINERRNLTLKTTSKVNQSPCCWISVENNIFFMNLELSKNPTKLAPYVSVFAYLLGNIRKSTAKMHKTVIIICKNNFYQHNSTKRSKQWNEEFYSYTPYHNNPVRSNICPNRIGLS